MVNTYPSEPLPLNLAARCLRIPARWLREEIDAGRVPALIAGRSVLVHVPTVAVLLADRAKLASGVSRGPSTFKATKEQSGGEA